MPRYALVSGSVRQVPTEATRLGHRAIMRTRRAKARELGRYVNETNAGTHGPATHGVRCASCDATHRSCR